MWLDFLLTSGGLAPVGARDVRFAFSCEEVLDAALLPRHGRNFVIADIMLAWRHSDKGLLAFEVKKPGGSMPTAQDVTKLETYKMLPSTRGIPTRQGVFLVDDRHVAALKRGGHNALGWSMVHLALMAGLEREGGPAGEIREVATALTRLFTMSGVKPRTFALPVGRGGQLSPRMAALRAGLRVRDAALRGETPSPPYAWLADEPTREAIPRLCPQTTAERRINRWSFDWNPSDET